ncbi:hypothetical protein KNO81_39410 [Paraburkholderia sediminicola]|nr:hypothetical protein [Paraburkholderia sediminicola]
MSRLTISCHANSDWMTIGGARVGAQQLGFHIRGWTDMTRLRTVRLVVCQSANPPAGPARDRLRMPFEHAFAGSLGAQVSTLLPGVIVKGFVGEVGATCSVNAVWEGHRIHGRAFEENALSHYFRIIKDGITENYHCITFLNGMAVRQAYPIHRKNGRSYALLSIVHPDSDSDFD